MSSQTRSEARPFNWQLALLFLTAIALSVASGWTTWDGMSNFTDTPWLSFLITFGIQGVMLVTAWLIGQSFVDAHVDDVPKPTHSNAARFAAVLFGIALVLAAIVALALFDALPAFFKTHVSDDVPIMKLCLLAGALVIGSAVIQFQEIRAAYVRNVSAIARNVPLWSMFLLCMMASVFFSFDSLFAKIYPPTERARASDIRAQRDLSVVLTKAAHAVAEQEAKAVKTLFTSQAWDGYNSGLREILTAASQAPALLRTQHAEEAAAASAAISEMRSDLARLDAQKAALEARRSTLAKQVDSLRDTLASHRAKREVLTTEREETISAATDLEAQMEAEQRGVGRSGKAGIGPAYRALNQQHVQLEIKLKELGQRIDEHAERREQLMSQLAAQETKSANLAGEISRLASQIDLRKTQLESGLKGGQAGVSQAVQAIEESAAEIASARKSFQKTATADDLVTLQQACTKTLVNLSTAGKAVYAGKPGIECSIGDLQGYVALIAERRRAAKTFESNCGKSAVTSQTSTSTLLDVGRTCVRMAALDAADTAALGSFINRIALRRDDTAHRFVVTTNAFLDGNQLAYLALLIAFAIDALVFMSGLFGAAAEASARNRGSGHRFQNAISMIERLSGPARFQLVLSTATDVASPAAVKMLLEKAKPIEHDYGYAFELHQDENQSNEITSLLNAGIAAGTVAWQYGAKPRYPRYLIMPGFFASLARAVSLPERVPGEDLRREEARIDRLAG